MLSRSFFRKPEERFGPHTVDLCRVGSKQPVRKVLFAALVPGNGERQRICVQLGRGVHSGQRPIKNDRKGVAEDAERRNGCYVARAIEGISHLVDALGAGRDPFR